MPAAAPKDPHALAVQRGSPRRLAPTYPPDSERGVLRWKASIARERRPLCVSLWSGAGGLDLGLERAGYRVAVAADLDKWACQTHGYNSEALVIRRDLSDPDDVREFLRELDLPPIALVAGGFPCQPFSRAGYGILRHLVESGRREAIDPRVLAWRSWVAAIEELRPQHAIAENVPDLARYNNGAQLRLISEGLEEIGYKFDFRILSARQFGVPQFRERLIIQAAQVPATICWPYADGRAVDDLRTAIADLPPIPPGHSEEEVPWPSGGRRSPPRWAQPPDEEPAETLVDHICRDVRADDAEAFRVLPSGGTYLDVPEHLRRYDDRQYTDKYKRLDYDKPSRTITAHIARDGYWYIHPEQDRTLSIREAARVQTFPDWYVFAGHPSNRFQQIGNAVPPLLGEAIGTALLEGNQGGHRGAEVCDAADLLVTVADEYWPALGPWEVLVSEAVFSGRASIDTVEAFLREVPAPETALASDSDDDRISTVRNLAAALQNAKGVPADPADLATFPGLTRATSVLVVSLVHGGEIPIASATTRVASRVSGVRRAGTLNGVLNVLLARLTYFGRSPAVNQLLVDLGRRVCTPEDPICGSCPLAEVCRYRTATLESATEAA